MTEALDVRYFSPPEGSAVFEAETAEALPDNVLPFVRPAATATLAEPATGAAARFTSLLGGLARVLSAVSPVLFLASDVSEEERLKRQPPVPKSQPEPILRCWADGRDDTPIRAFDSGYTDADEDQVKLTGLFIRLNQARAARALNGEGDFASEAEIGMLEGLLSFYRTATPLGLGIANPLGSTGSGKGTAGGTSGDLTTEEQARLDAILSEYPSARPVFQMAEEDGESSRQILRLFQWVLDNVEKERAEQTFRLLSKAVENGFRPEACVDLLEKGGEHMLEYAILAGVVGLSLEDFFDLVREDPDENVFKVLKAQEAEADALIRIAKKMGLSREQIHQIFLDMTLAGVPPEDQIDLFIKARSRSNPSDAE